MKLQDLFEYDITAHQKGDEYDPRSPSFEDPLDGETSTEIVTFPWEVLDQSGNNVIASGTVTAEVTGGVDEKGQIQLDDINMHSFEVDGEEYSYQEAIVKFGKAAFRSQWMMDAALDALEQRS